MYTVEFYENDRGVSELWDFLEDLRIKSASNKDARIQYKQIVLYIQLLQDNGTRLSENVTKHLMDGIWELRPGNNRVFYFCWRGDRFVLLHQFRKRSQKTPRREIERAKAERDDWLARTGKDSADWSSCRYPHPDIAKDIREAEAMSAIVKAMVEQRNAMGLSQRELAARCGIPQSSVARIESFKTMPNLDTLLKIFQQLGLKLTISAA